MWRDLDCRHDVLDTACAYLALWRDAVVMLYRGALLVESCETQDLRLLDSFIIELLILPPDCCLEAVKPYTNNRLPI